MSFRGTNASSGMGVADQSKSTYLELQRKKVHRYVIFKIDEKKKEVVVEKTGGPTESYDDFTASLPENDCRYAVYDYDFVTSENCQKSKIFFIAWSPSVSRIRAKMLYATSKDRFRRELQGIHYEIQATDPTEMELEVLHERANYTLFLLKGFYGFDNYVLYLQPKRMLPVSDCYFLCAVPVSDTKYDI